MDSTHLQIMPKPLQNKLSIPFTNWFYETFHFYNKLFLSSEGVSKGSKHHLIYQTKEIKQESY
jgi:hypothetical protein